MIKPLPQIRLLLICFLFSTIGSYAQLDFDVACRSAEPYCSSSEVELPPFMNIIGQDIDFQGLGCLDSTRNNSWLYILIDEPGELVFEISQWVDADGDNRFDRNETPLDVDFIAWGPFPTSFVNCEEDLPRGCDNDGDMENLRPEECENNIDFPDYYIEDQDNTDIMDCSFARESTETFTIPNGQNGEYYLILITNFSDQSGVINMEQTNVGADGAGTTDCSILDPGVGPDIAVCGPDGFPITIEGRYPGAVTFQWQRRGVIGTDADLVDVPAPEGTFPFLEINSPGVYRLIGRDILGIEVEGSPDELVVVDVSNAIEQVLPSVAEESFSGSYTITTELVTSAEIQASDLTAFEYRLDIESPSGSGTFVEFIPFQSSPVFTGVPAGDYQVVARYANCPASEVTSEIIMILGYPQFFSPNGDGTNDTWNLINPEVLTQPALIYIFDRYGKLLKQLTPNGPGWDGTYNGRNMPSSAYWFRVEFNEPTDPNMRRRVFAGNFSLIR
ncbi:T9SS type B sorting domain-containing protein [Aquimarina sp. MMG016]|uniref:T9SS type B sorting domain-containing protein n=1 Tax=Aquimarina sp. MMG016 TaxID=2822690 RepID=UPI001B3A17BC|nr:T9SS type B sorting domain-containing protein [Aquimarina sp. MMG016]MBQ4820497.1 T9SS type B sorting domain-containing protein [Aquimarina sp. MMG016]